MAISIDRELYFRVERLHADYIGCIDDDRLEEWPYLFIDAGRYEVMPRENADRGLPMPLLLCDNRKMMLDRVLSLRRANIYQRHHYRHMSSGLRITGIEAGEIHAQANYLVVQTLLDGETRIYQAGRYLDRIVDVDGALKFAERRALYDTSRVQTLLATPV